MHLRIETLFDGDPEELDLPEAAEDPALAGVVPASSDPHQEDALLAELARWLGRRGADPAACASVHELAREALDQLGDPDAPWQALPVDRWLAAAAPNVDMPEELAQHAQAFVAFLGDSGRLGLHGQRLLERQIASARLVRAQALPRTPQLAA